MSAIRSDAVWVFAEHASGRFRRVAWEALGLGQKLAAAHGKKLVAVTLGEDSTLAEQLTKKQADEVVVATHPQLGGHYNADTYVAAFKALAAEARPFMLIAGHTYQSFDFVPRLAAFLGAGLISEVTGWSGGLSFTRPLFGGKLSGEFEFKGDAPYVVTCQPGAFPADAVATAQAPLRTIAIDIPAASIQRQVIEILAGVKDQIDLSKAERIVAVGRGIGGEDKMSLIKELAEVLGAEIGASRPVVDSGWLPRDRQIGSSGQTVAPKLYIGVGISGAIQHVTGIKNSGCIVAVNRDGDAPIFSDATYGVVGDLFEFLPAFIEVVKKARA